MMKRLSIISLCLYHYGITSADLPIIDVNKVKGTLRSILYNVQSIDQLTQQIVTQSLLQEDPVTAFLEQADLYGCNYKKNVMSTLIKEDPVILCIFAEYFFKNRPYFSSYEQQFIQDWKESLQGQKSLTQTCAHLTTQGLKKPLDFFSDHYQPQLIKAALKERELNDQGYIVFYHGQQNFFGFYQDFCKKLLLECFKQGVVTYKLPDDFFFVRIPSSLKDLMNNGLSVTTEQEEIAKRQEVINSLNTSLYYDTCLSVNGFLFGSTGTKTCSTWNFIVTNSNSRFYKGPDLGLQIFQNLGYINHFNQYQRVIKGLAREYTQFFKAGRLLQIAVPVQLVDECVFMATRGACKTSVFCSSSYRPIAKVSEQMSYCKKRDRVAYGYGSGKSENHYCVVMTEDMALNPRSGIKYFSYDGQPEQEITFRFLGEERTVTYLEHCTKVDELVCDIVQHLKYKSR